MDRGWYVVHTQSGFEDRVRTLLQQKIDTDKLQDKIFSIFIPTEDVVEVKKNKKKISKRKFFETIADGLGLPRPKGRVPLFIAKSLAVISVANIEKYKFRCRDHRASVAGARSQSQRCGSAARR